MAPEAQLAFVVVATVALLALALAAFNSVRIEALRREKEKEKQDPKCDRLHASEMDDHGLSIVVQAGTPSPSPQYITVEEMPSMTGPVLDYVDLDLDPPPTKKSPS